MSRRFQVLAWTMVGVAALIILLSVVINFATPRPSHSQPEPRPASAPLTATGHREAGNLRPSLAASSAAERAQRRALVHIERAARVVFAIEQLKEKYRTLGAYSNTRGDLLSAKQRVEERLATLHARLQEPGNPQEAARLHAQVEHEISMLRNIASELDGEPPQNDWSLARLGSIQKLFFANEWSLASAILPPLAAANVESALQEQQNIQNQNAKLDAEAFMRGFMQEEVARPGQDFDFIPFYQERLNSQPGLWEVRNALTPLLTEEALSTSPVLAYAWAYAALNTFGQGLIERQVEARWIPELVNHLQQGHYVVPDAWLVDGRVPTEFDLAQLLIRNPQAGPTLQLASQVEAVRHVLRSYQEALVLESRSDPARNAARAASEANREAFLLIFREYFSEPEQLLSQLEPLRLNDVTPGVFQFRPN